MNQMLRCSNFLTLLLVAGMVLFTFGCKTTKQGRSVETSGFLKDYSQLTKNDNVEALLSYKNPKADFSKYDKMIIDTVSIVAVEDSSLSKMDKDDAETLANYFKMAIEEEIAKDFQIVTEPGPGTLRLRAAITEADGSIVVADAVTSLIPATRLIGTGIQLAANTAVVVGETQVEVELLDSQTDERLMAAVDERSGTKVLRGSLKTWGDAHSAYRLWAKRIRVKLEEERLPTETE